MIALLGLNLVELKLNIDSSYFSATTEEAMEFYSSFPSLRTLHLCFSDIPPDGPARGNASKVVHAFLDACPALNSLLLVSDDLAHPMPAVSLFELSTTGENQLKSGPPPLTAITLKYTKLCLTPGLASCFNIQALRELYLEASENSIPTAMTEGFWAALANMGSNTVHIERLQCPRLTPCLIKFLYSLTGLRWLKFSRNFCPFSPLKNPDTDIDTRRKPAAFDPHDLSADELRLVDAFFNRVIPKHNASLEYLVFGEEYGDDERWSMTPDYLRQISRCMSLRTLQFHVRTPVDDLVGCLLRSNMSSRLTAIFNVSGDDARNTDSNAFPGNAGSHSPTLPNDSGTPILRPSTGVAPEGN